MNIKGRRNLYLKTVSVEEAQDKYMKALEEANAFSVKTESINVYDSLGRITSEAVYAVCCSPLFNAAAMDGIAVTAAATAGAGPMKPLRLEYGRDYEIIDTGDPVKAPFDAVIMAEEVIEVDDGVVEINQSVPGWHHVRPIGEDIVAGEMLLPSHHKIRPEDIGVLLAGGILEIEVFAKPTVAVIPTGSEIVPPGAECGEGNIIDSNSGMFAAEVLECGGIPMRYEIAEDDFDIIKARLLTAVEKADVVLINAGSSAGTEDFSETVLSDVGKVVVHGVAMKPGKPVILAMVGNKPVICLPGYPVSAYLAFETFAAPVIKRLTGNMEDSDSNIEAVLSKRLVSSLKHREYVRVKVGRVGNRYVASPLARGAGAAMSLVRADGFCVIPQNSEGFEAGETVEIKLSKPIEQIDGTLVCIGSHDMLLDVLNDMMGSNYPGLSLSSSHVGSLAGLMALNRGETVIAPTHLLDDETGEYNISYIKKLFPDEKMAIIKGVDRIQGIMVKKGNPLGISGVGDLNKVRYVNRQRGAGTRVLLDYLLKQAGISSEAVNGYDKEAATHMAVAAAVASKEADAGMGIKSAAFSMGLDFIEVGAEEYDFAIRAENLELPVVKAFIKTLCSEAFRKKLERAGGYGFSKTGDIILL